MSRSVWDIYQRRLNKNGTTQRDRTIINAQRLIAKDFSDSPSYKSVTINGIDRDVQIIEEHALRSDSNKKRILCKPDESISIGDLVVWNTISWLCTDTEDNIAFYERGVIEKCNNNLKYIDSAGGLITIPCVVTDRILMGQTENDYYILPDNKIMVMVADDEDSEEIVVDKRFLLNDNAYKVESIDNITKPGLNILKMSFDAITQNDNKDLGVADYYSNLVSYSINILNGDEANVALGESILLELECKDNDSVITSPDVTFTLEEGSTGYISVDSSGLVSADAIGSGSIIATYNSSTDSININVVTSTTSTYVYSLVGDIQPQNEIKYNQQKEFTAYKRYATGTVVTGAIFEFSVTLSGTGDSSSNYLLTTSTDNSAILKCLQYPYSISLVATDQDDITQSVTQVISLKGLI
jgi:hypothetical protein